MMLAEYIVLFVLVATTGAGLPGAGDASLIAAGTLAGEGRLNVGIVLAVSGAAWMLGSVVGYEIGFRKGRWLLDHPGRLEKRRLKLLAKGDRASRLADIWPSQVRQNTGWRRHCNPASGVIRSPGPGLDSHQ